MSLSILQLLEENETIDDAVIDAFLEHHISPIVEGPSITFLFRGAADRVRLRHFVYGLPSRRDFQQLDGTDLWYLVIEVPPQSRIEYKFEVTYGGHRRLIRDPLNPHVAHDPFGGNSVCHGAGYEVPTWTEQQPETKPGDLHDHTFHSQAMGNERHFTVYTPARMRRTRRYPLLVVFDGLDYARYASFKTVLDNLIHAYEIAPMIVVLCHPTDRMHDYTAEEQHARFVVEELLPFVEAHYPVRARAQDRGLMGASLGGVAALSTAWRHPGVFGALLLQSGSFAFTDVGGMQSRFTIQPVVDFVSAFRADPGRPADKVFVSCGIYEPLIYENRSLVALLQGRGIPLRYVEARDGHNWENWRDRLREGLSWLFPGPLGLIYD
jgi:enterochelin esterase family protein